MKNPPFGPEFLPKNIASREKVLEPKQILSRVPQPGLHLKRGKIHSIRDLSGYFIGTVGFPFSSTSGWTKER